jgi:hypothetical protein
VFVNAREREEPGDARGPERAAPWLRPGPQVALVGERGSKRDVRAKDMTGMRRMDGVDE